MQAVGVLAITIGVWLIYCGVTGVPPIPTLLAILKEPEKASQIIADARDAASGNANDLTAGYKLGGKIKNYVAGSNPFSSYKITDDFATHKGRSGDQKSDGGVDFAMPAGTPLPAPFPGVVTYIPGSGGGGNIITITLDNGYKSQFLHVRRATIVSGTRVKAGTIVGLSGGVPGEPGAGSSTGPHLHWHMLDPQGNRIDPLEYLKTKGK